MGCDDVVRKNLGEMAWSLERGRLSIDWGEEGAFVAVLAYCGELLVVVVVKK